MGWGGESGIAEELREDLFESIGFVELFCLGVVGVIFINERQMLLNIATESDSLLELISFFILLVK